MTESNEYLQRTVLPRMIRSMLMVSLTALALSAQTPQPPPQVVSHGEGVVSAKPDQVRIQIGVTNQAPTASEAGAQNAKRSAAVIAELKQQLGTAAEYQTSNYSLFPNYRTQRDGGGNPTISGYQANNTVEVKLNDITLAGKAVDIATKTGANQIQGIHFSIRNEQAVRGQALAAAATQARANAEALAKAVGLRIVKLLRVEDGEPVRVMPMRRELMMAKAADAASTPVEPGEIEVRATVTITAEVAP
jgi:uncharacterized protein YggE